MTYEQFVQAVEKGVTEGIKDKTEVSVHTAVKNNGRVRKGLLLSEPGLNISPVVYLEEYYERQKRGTSVETIAKEIVDLYEEIRFDHSWESDGLHNYENVKDKIIYRLVGKEKNRKQLSGMPCESFLDMAIVFGILLEKSDHGTATMPVTDGHIKLWGVDSKELCRQAHANTERLLPCEFLPISTVIEELSQVGEDADMWEGENEKSESMYVLTNHLKSYGAAVILYEDRLCQIGDYLGENFFVLPSSVHETIIIPESTSPDREMLIEMVRDMNATQVGEEEILTDNAYYYNRQKKKLVEQLMN